MGNNLDVSISANVADLQAKFAVARAEYVSLGQEMNKLAKQSAAGVLDPAGEQQLQQAAADFVHAKTEAANLSAELKRTSQSFKEVGDSIQGGIGGALEDVRGKISTAFEVTGVTAAYEAVEKLGEEIEKLGDRALQMRSYSEILNVNIEQFQAMQVAAEEAGTSTEVLARAAERLSVLLNEARNHSSSAIEKLLELGVTTKEIADPQYKLIQLFQTLRERLDDSATKQSTMNALMAEFGPRAALAAEAIKEFDGSQQGVAKIMGEINGLTEGNAKAAAAARAEWGKFGTATENTFTKFLFGTRAMEGGIHGLIESMGELSNKAHSVSLPSLGAAPSTQGADAAIEGQKEAAKQAAAIQADLSRDILKQEMDNAKAGVEAFKEGSRQKLAQLQVYAAAARAFYGDDEADAVVKANQQIIAEQRAVNESDQQFTEQQMQRTERLQSARLSAITKQIQENTRYFEEETRFEDELYGGWSSTYAEINNRHAQMLHEQSAATARNAKEQVKTWQSMVGEIENAEGTLVSDLLNRRKSLSQSLLSIGANLVTQEISNDIKAFTTRKLLGGTEAATTKALEQGGLLFHLHVEAQKTAAKHASEAAQTGAAQAGNATRLAAATSTQAASQAQAAAVGPATVMGEAARAYAGTFASIAAIPYVGPFLAPEMAAAAFADVAAFAGMAALDTGTNYVPRDMVAQIHEGEAVVPKQYNPAANPSAAQAGGGGGYSEEHNYNGDMHVSALDAPSLKRMLGRPGGRDSVLSAAMRSFRRGAR